MASNPGLEQARYKGMLESLQQQDRDIEHIIVYSKFVVVYILQQDGPSTGWKKGNIEGPVYLVRRRSLPQYQLLVKNQFSSDDLLDNLHPNWELDCQQNYVFYKVEDPSERVRGLWFHDDEERKKLEAAIEKTLQEMKSRTHEPQTEPLPRAAEAMPGGGAEIDALFNQFGLQPQQQNGAGGKGGQPGGGEQIPLTREKLRSALHELIDTDEFLNLMWNKLRMR